MNALELTFDHLLKYQTIKCYSHVAPFQNEFFPIKDMTHLQNLILHSPDWSMFNSL